MQKISLQKRSFFNSIGLDVNNLPKELETKTNSIQKVLPKEDLLFLNSNNLTRTESKHFRLKNLIGTDNINYNNKTWIEIFSDNEKSDEIVKLYYKNPNYYFKELRKIDQSTLLHNNPLELYEDNGKFFIKDGVGRLSFMMIKYLLEMSRAQSKEERLLINRQYIFSANVRSIPKDKDIMYLIMMLQEIYGPKLKLQKADNAEECNYFMKYEDKKFEIKTKKELENFIKNSYLPKEYKTLDKLKAKLQNFVKIGFDYKENEQNEENFLIMGKIFPNYEIFIKYYKKICKYNLENNLYDKLDINNISYEVLLKKLIKIVKQEEISMKEKSVKKEKKVSEESAKTKVVSSKEKSKKENVKAKVLEKEEPEKKEIKKDIKKKEDDIKEKIKAEKDLVNSEISNILDNIEMMYYKFKTEEAKSFDLANSLSIELNIDRISDDAINSNLNSIKENSLVLKKKINDSEELKQINDISELLKDLKKISNDRNIINEYNEEMKNIFMVCFNKNAQKLINDSKLKKLEKQRIEIENEKCSFFSKLIGKAKLKQAKLDNISLKEQLILSEAQFFGNSYYIEDGLSDIYSYIKNEEDDSCLTEIKLFLRDVETNNQIKNMIDQEKLSRKIKEKVEQQRNLPQLTLGKEKRHFFSKAQINMMQEKNNELKRVIQINRANSLKKQNTGIVPIMGNIKFTKSIKKFINNLTQIDNSIKLQCN